MNNALNTDYRYWYGRYDNVIDAGEKAVKRPSGAGRVSFGDELKAVKLAQALEWAFRALDSLLMKPVLARLDFENLSRSVESGLREDLAAELLREEEEKKKLKGAKYGSLIHLFYLFLSNQWDAFERALGNYNRKNENRKVAENPFFV